MIAYLKFRPEEIYLQSIAILFYWTSYISWAMEYEYPFLIALWTQTPYLILDVAACYIIYFWICPDMHKKLLLIIPKHIVLFVVFVIVYWTLDQVIPEYQDGAYQSASYPLSVYFSYTINYLIPCSIIAYGLYYYNYGIHQANTANRNKIQLAQKAEKLAKEAEMIATKELDYYKGEFNSHFTFNILTYFQSKTYDLPQIFDPLLMFTDILRYNTSSNSRKLVELEREIEYFQNFIKLNKLLHPNLHICLHVEGDTSNTMIYPRIIMGFLENAIKHGAAYDANHPIRMTLNIKEETLLLSIINKKRKVPVRNSTKKGLEISRLMLEKLYPDKHKLTIVNGNDTFKVYLELTTSQFVDHYANDLHQTYHLHEI
jgi:hypothetical protein